MGGQGGRNVGVEVERMGGGSRRGGGGGSREEREGGVEVERRE